MGRLTLFERLHKVVCESRDSQALRYAADHLTDDREIVMQAVSKDGQAMFKKPLCSSSARRQQSQVKICSESLDAQIASDFRYKPAWRFEIAALRFQLRFLSWFSTDSEAIRL